MPVSLSDLEQQAKSLSPDDHARLAEVLLESLREKQLSEIERACDSTLSVVEAAWNREIEERVAAYDCDQLQALAADAVFADARRITR
jgi:putative addiction module component (TIGR02574 family)